MWVAALPLWIVFAILMFCVFCGPFIYCEEKAAGKDKDAKETLGGIFVALFAASFVAFLAVSVGRL